MHMFDSNVFTRAHICMAENSNSNNNKQTDRVAWKGWKRKSDWFVVGNKSTEERTYMLSCLLRYPSAMSTFESRLHLNRSPYQFRTLTRPHIHSYYKSISTLWFPHSTHNVVACTNESKYTNRLLEIILWIWVPFSRVNNVNIGFVYDNFLLLFTLNRLP